MSEAKTHTLTYQTPSPSHSRVTVFLHLDQRIRPHPQIQSGTLFPPNAKTSILVLRGAEGIRLPSVEPQVNALMTQTIHSFSSTHLSRKLRGVGKRDSLNSPWESWGSQDGETGVGWESRWEVSL